MVRFRGARYCRLASADFYARRQSGIRRRARAVIIIDEQNHKVHYVRQPFNQEPDFNANSVNYDFAGLIAKAEVPQ